MDKVNWENIKQYSKTVLPVNKLFEREKQKEGFQTIQVYEYTQTTLQTAIFDLISLFIAVVAGYASWYCNETETPFMRLLYSFLAFMFGGIYLLYFWISGKSNTCKFFVK